MQVTSENAISDAAEAARQRLESAKAALVVIDIQAKLLPPIYEGERLLRNAGLLLRLAGILNLPVLVTTQYARGLGETVPEIAEVLPRSTKVHDKLEFSCFGSDKFCSAKALVPNREQLLICGMAT